ncbi:LacI family transcriptional regulator [Cohnella faecalis]|uniref:LacI family transcriptional regulator n=1 Tax=Cohnella faecalis TaxID=2315694 RepID=A0A398CNQ1_9BACL|nr:LacI family transcriptional regulator [Cohnella faecalis]RIE03870.1 LacI family transcriptional regulator [Cohnella faecalis]
MQRHRLREYSSKPRCSARKTRGRIIVAPIEFPSVESQKEFYSYLESLSSKLSDQSIPVVFINNDLQETSLSCVSIDNYLSARLAMEHLLAWDISALPT